MRNIKFGSIFILLFFALCSESSGFFDKAPQSRESLKGIQGFYVMADIGKVFEEIGLFGETIRTDAELKLRQAGIRVFALEETKAIPGNPAFYIYLMGLKQSDIRSFPLYLFRIDVYALQNARLERNNASYGWAPTWSEDYIGMRGSDNPDVVSKHIRDVTKDLIDRFINAYLSVNPKREK
jgi:hypothetical protein